MPQKPILGVIPLRSPAPKLTDEQKIASIVAIAMARGTHQDIADFAREHQVQPEALRELAAALEDNAKIIRQGAQRLEPRAIADDEDDD